MTRYTTLGNYIHGYISPFLQKSSRGLAFVLDYIGVVSYYRDMENNKHCSVEGCTNELSAYNKTGMCGWHSTRVAKGLSVHPCSTEGCANFRANDFEAIGLSVKCHLHSAEVK